jgi:GDPmannose 4,6-dehydratase
MRRRLLRQPGTSLVKRALIIGVSGQDGAYLAKLLLDKGYEVFGTSRDAALMPFDNLMRLGIRDRVRVRSVAPNDFRSLLHALVQVNPDELYNLSGQSSVGLSFDQPVETMESINTATLNLLEAIRFTGKPIRFYNASSGECFGDTSGVVSEESPFRPRSPYAVAKASAHWLVANYREAYHLFACSGVLFNHESPLRPVRFVTRKIVQGAVRIAAGVEKTLVLGNLDIYRDWGWAPEYVDAMWRMLQQEQPGDFIIATGQTRSLQEFVATAFRLVGIDWRDHVRLDSDLLRPTDIRRCVADPTRAAQRLGWRASTGMEEIIQRMIDADRATIDRTA